MKTLIIYLLIVIGIAVGSAKANKESIKDSYEDMYNDIGYPDNFPRKTVDLRHLVIPTDSGLTYRDTSLYIEVVSDNSVVVNGKVYTGLTREVTPSPEDDMVYDLYSNKDESFNLCFDLSPDNSDIKQVVIFYLGQYYCYR